MGNSGLRINPASPRYKWAVLLVAALGSYASVIDMGVVNISLPSITAHFRADLPTIQWVVSIYLVTIAATLMPLGRAADMFGRRRLYIGGLLLFSVGSVLAGTALNIPSLFVARSVQAVGAASIQGVGMAMAVAVFPPQERGKALGVMATVIALGAVSGPNIGGVLIDAFGWRSAFFINGVLGPVSAAIAFVVLRESALGAPKTGKARFDWLGMASSALAIVSTLLVISRGHSAGWTSTFVVTFSIIAAVSLAVFFIVERRAQEPMIEFSFFRHRVFALGSAASWLAFTAVSTSIFLMPFYLQGILDFKPRIAAVILTPTAVSLALAGLIAGRLSDRIGARIPATLGMLLATAGFASLSRITADSSLLHIIPSMMAMGAGMGMFQPANNSWVLSTVERARYGVAASFLTLVRNLGQITGIAIATLVVTLSITSLGMDPNLGPLRSDTQTASPLLIDAFVTGLRRTFLISAGIVGVAAILSLARGARSALQEQTTEEPVKSVASQQVGDKAEVASIAPDR